MERRQFLNAGASLTLLGPFAGPVLGQAATDARFVLVILRGGLDGLAAISPWSMPQPARIGNARTSTARKSSRPVALARAHRMAAGSIVRSPPWPRRMTSKGPSP